MEAARRDRPGDPVVRALRAMAGATEEVLRTSSADLGRVDGLVRDAARALMASFTALDATTAEQRAHMGAALERLEALTEARASGGDDEGGLSSFVSSARVTLEKLVELLTGFSKENLRVTFLVEDLSSELESMFDVVEQVDVIADDIGLLSVNAALEAARAGPEGRGFGVVSAEVRRLSHTTKALNETVSGHVETAGKLLKEVEKGTQWMGARDLGLDATVRFQDELAAVLDEIQAANDQVQATLASIEASAQTLEGHVSDAIRALQFDDMSTQIVAAVRARLDQLALRLTETVNGLDPERSPEALADAVEAALAPDAAEAVHMPAQQEDVDAGEAFLF